MKISLYNLLVVLLLFTGCGKEENYIPDVVVNYSTLLTDPALTGLSSGKPIIVNGYGIAGLILYRNVAGRYMAYDRCSTVNPEKKCALNINDTYIEAVDPCSGAKFLLEDGSPAKAPAEKYLKQYMVNISGNTIRVSN